MIGRIIKHFLVDGFSNCKYLRKKMYIHRFILLLYHNVLPIMVTAARHNMNYYRGILFFVLAFAAHSDFTISQHFSIVCQNFRL